MFIMHLSKLQNVFLERFKRISINATYFNVLSKTLSHTAYNNYSTSFCTNITRDLAFLNQQSISLNNVIIRRYSSRVQNNFHYMSYPQIVSHVHNNKREKHIGCKTYSSQYYNSIRCFSSTSVDSIAETQVPMQFSGIFKTLSESTLVKISQDSLLWMHDYTGLPWWSVIVLTTIMMRTAITLPLALYQVDLFWYPLYIYIFSFYSCDTSIYLNMPQYSRRYNEKKFKTF